MNLKLFLFQGAKGDGFPGKQLADVDLVTFPRDVAGIADRAERGVKRIGQAGQFGGEGSRARAIEESGRLLLQGLVRPFVVVDVLKAMKSLLLLRQREARRGGGIPLESEVEAFMTAILLGGSELDSFGEDAETDPPNGQAAQARNAVGGEGGSIVGANAFGEPKLTEGGLEDATGVWAVGFRDDLATNEEAAIGVGDGQGIAAVAIAADKPAFEVGAPNVVWSFGMGERSGVGRSAAARGASAAEAFPAQQVADGTGSGPGVLGLVFFEPVAKLARTPSGIFTAQAKDTILQDNGGEVGLRVGSTGFLYQAGFSLAEEAIDPLVTGGTTYTELTAKRRKTYLAFLPGVDKSQTFIHRAGFLPRHRGPSSTTCLTTPPENCKGCARSELSTMCPDWTHALVFVNAIGWYQQVVSAVRDVSAVAVLTSEAMLSQNATIIIVDDNQFEGRVLQQAVKSYGFSTLLLQTCAEAQAALQQDLEQHERAIFVLDFHLGPENANDLLRDLPESLQLRVQVVVCTGSCPPHGLIDWDRAAAVWEKPFDLDGYQSLAQRIAQMAEPGAFAKAQSA